MAIKSKGSKLQRKVSGSFVDFVGLKNIKPGARKVPGIEVTTLEDAAKRSIPGLPECDSTLR